MLCIQGSPRCYLLYMASWRPYDRAQAQEGCSEGFEEIKSCLSWKMGDDELRVVSPSKGCWLRHPPAINMQGSASASQGWFNRNIDTWLVRYRWWKFRLVVVWTGGSQLPLVRLLYLCTPPGESTWSPVICVHLFAPKMWTYLSLIIFPLLPWFGGKVLPPKRRSLIGGRGWCGVVGWGGRTKLSGGKPCEQVSQSRNGIWTLGILTEMVTYLSPTVAYDTANFSSRVQWTVTYSCSVFRLIS